MPNWLTNLEIAAQLRDAAKRTSDKSDNKRYLSLAELYDREDGLIGGALRAIAESKALLVEVDKLLASQ